MMSVRLWPEPLHTIELQPVIKFKCVHCGLVTDRVNCILCYPTPVFPHIIPYTDKRPPSDYEGYKEWDRWFTWRYLLEFIEDPEEKYLY